MLQDARPGSGEPRPDGFLYRPQFLASEEHDALLDAIRELPCGEFRMRGVAARRRVVRAGATGRRAAGAGSPLRARSARRPGAPRARPIRSHRHGVRG